MLKYRLIFLGLFSLLVVVLALVGYSRVVKVSRVLMPDIDITRFCKAWDQNIFPFYLNSVVPLEKSPYIDSELERTEELKRYNNGGVSEVRVTSKGDGYSNIGCHSSRTTSDSIEIVEGWFVGALDGKWRLTSKSSDSEKQVSNSTLLFERCDANSNLVGTFVTIQNYQGENPVDITISKAKSWECGKFIILTTEMISKLLRKN